MGGSDGRTEEGGADVTMYPLGQPCQPSGPLTTTKTTATAMKSPVNPLNGSYLI